MTALPSASALRSWQESRDVLRFYLESGAHFALTPGAVQIHLGTVIRDATTSYEIYLTGALAELFGAYGRTFRSMGMAPWPSWAELKRQYLRCMECDIEPQAIQRIRTLRHVLTHRHGQVETAEERLLFSDLLSDETPQESPRIQLHQAVAQEALFTFDQQVVMVQSMVSHFSCGRGRSRVLSAS